MIPPRVATSYPSPFSLASFEDLFEDTTPVSSNSETPLYDDSSLPSPLSPPPPPLIVHEPPSTEETVTSLRRELDMATGSIAELR